MQLRILGCHSPFPGPSQATPGYLLEVEGKNILLDCGTGIVGQLQKYCPVHKLDAIVISHLHPDHSLDLVPLAFAAMREMMNGRLTQPIPVFMPPGGTQLFFKLANLQGDLASKLTVGLSFSDYEVGKTELAGIEAKLFSTFHPMQCHGIFIHSKNGAFAYTADTSFFSELPANVKGADMLLAEAGGISPEQAALAKHLLPEETGRLAVEADAKTLILTHFLPDANHELLRSTVESIYDGVLYIAEEGLLVTL